LYYEIVYLQSPSLKNRAFYKSVLIKSFQRKMAKRSKCEPKSIVERNRSANLVENFNVIR